MTGLVAVGRYVLKRSHGSSWKDDLVLRVLAALLVDLDWIPSTQMVAHNHL